VLCPGGVTVASVASQVVFGASPAFCSHIFLAGP
jgi:hypothetical protein